MQGLLQRHQLVQRPLLELRQLLPGMRGVSQGGRLLRSHLPHSKIPKIHGLPKQLPLPRNLPRMQSRRHNQKLQSGGQSARIPVQNLPEKNLHRTLTTHRRMLLRLHKLPQANLQHPIHLPKILLELQDQILLTVPQEGQRRMLLHLQTVRTLQHRRSLVHRPLPSLQGQLTQPHGLPLRPEIMPHVLLRKYGTHQENLRQMSEVIYVSSIF
jgi:hypothetical protein